MQKQKKRAPEKNGAALIFRQPTAEDGPSVWRMVAECPPLDRNSLYCNLLQCSDFADTCVLAEFDGEPVGWVSGYRPPGNPSALFVWQVAVRPEARGMQLARKMIESLLERSACNLVTRIEATVTPSNEASRAVFESIAASLNAPISQRLRFDAETHLRGDGESEHLVTIGPIPKHETVPDRAAIRAQRSHASI